MCTPAPPLHDYKTYSEYYPPELLPARLWIESFAVLEMQRVLDYYWLEDRSTNFLLHCKLQHGWNSAWGALVVEAYKAHAYESDMLYAQAWAKGQPAPPRPARLQTGEWQRAWQAANWHRLRRASATDNKAAGTTTW